MPNNKSISAKYYFFSRLRPVYYMIAAILCFHIVLFVAIQALRLSFSPRLFVIILLRLVSMHSWRRLTGLGVLNIQYFRTFLGFRLWFIFIFTSVCSHLDLLISMNWCREWQLPSLSHTFLLVIHCSFTSNIIVIPAIFLSDRRLQAFFFVLLWVPSFRFPIAGGSLLLLRRIKF